ncbi:hypothetical protein C5C95_16925 [Rathayibacter sp. AY1B7]|uniref:hypothetical protein n=1 Tax=Rathayibacter sp. AY1B7 TaxID=2080532 RepID=UPI000CE8A7D9|nr:hypothetical protein [Rathayibacter sp. AY1B7]PPH95174.1 hypothetical protein C5C95_16925 [Rathayibacter sp. AY1B7]
MIPVTVHVPPQRVEEFYIRFGEFIADTAEPDAPVRLPSGTVPAWVLGDDADELATRFWGMLSFEGRRLLDRMTENESGETQSWTPDELATRYGHPGGKSKVAGVLGGVGKAAGRAGLPRYRTPSGGPGYYIWDWEQQRYSMTPEVARILRAARKHSD